MTTAPVTNKRVSRDTNVVAQLAPFQQYLDDPDVTEIRVNKPGQVVTDTRSQGRVLHDRPDITLKKLEALTKALCHWNGVARKAINYLELPDGSRGTIVWPPAVLTGTVLVAFRKHLPVIKTLEDLEREGRFAGTRQRTYSDARKLEDFEQDLLDKLANNQLIEFFRGAVNHKLNIAIAGSTGSGKSTFTRSLIREIPVTERLIVLEDVHEAGSDAHHEMGYMRYGDGAGRVSASECLTACMRLTPDRIILTELRDDAAWDYLEASNTAHPGGIFSTHAESAASVPARLATLVKRSDIGRGLDWEIIMKTINTTLDVIIFMEHYAITEVLYDPQFKKEQMMK